MIFEITPEHIEQLNDTDLRTLIGYLAEQEISKAGYSAANVKYGGHQNAADDGIDVDVELNKGELDGYIPRAFTGIQVKAENMARADILKEMRPEPANVLRPSIVQLGEKEGAYIIASSKSSCSKPSLTRRKNAMAEAIADAPAAAGLHLDFYDQRRIATWVNQHPGLIPWVRDRIGLPLSGWRPFGDWSSSPEDMEASYFADDYIRIVGVRLKEEGGLNAVQGIEKLRNILSQPKGIIRLVGLSGVGKTRLVQALFDSNLGENALNPQLAVYADVADGPDPVPLELLSQLVHLNQRCVLIIDNCGVELHRKLAARMRNTASLLSLITVEYDISDDEPENTDVFKLEPASAEIVEKIINRHYPALTVPEVNKIAEFSEGNARIAIALAETAGTGESVANLRDSELFKRLFRQNNEENPALLRAAKVCSLVYSFEGESTEGDDVELPVLASLAEQSAGELYSHVAELYRRQLVQKRNRWRAVLPHALAHKLAKEALQEIPRDTLLQKLTREAPERLIKSFSKRIGCLHDLEEAQTIVSGWLESDGWLPEVENFNDLGIVLFENIAPVNPNAVLNAIKAASERENDLFSEHYPYRGQLVGVLRALAYDPSLFDDAIDLIRKFAQPVLSSNIHSEASNVFKSLFFIWLSGTHAPAEQRIRHLRRLAESDDCRDHSLLFDALDAMLECHHFSSGYSFEFGTRKRDFGLRPTGREAVSEWYQSVIDFCYDLSQLDAHREKIRTLIAKQFRQLITGTGMVDEFISLADKFAQDGDWSEGWAGVRGAARAIKRDDQEEDRKKLSSLADRLKPQSLDERITSYVLPAEWSSLEIAELELEDPDDYDSKKYNLARKKVEEKCREIGKELANDLVALKKHLPAILSSKGNRGGIIAEEIGRHAKEVDQAWDLIVTEARELAKGEIVSSFPGVFLSGLSEREAGKAEEFLDSALDDTNLHSFLVHLQVCVGLNEKGVARLLKATSLSSIPVNAFNNLAWGKPLDLLSGRQIRTLLLAISDLDGGLAVAFDILHICIFSRQSDKRPIESEIKQVGCELLTRLDFIEKRPNKDYHLAKIATACIAAPKDEHIAAQICQRFRQALAGYKTYSWNYPQLMAVLVENFPRAVLDVLVEGGQVGFEGRRGIFSSLRERQPCPWQNVDPEILIEWANEQPDARFVQVAEVIRPWSKADGGVPEDDGGSSESLIWTSAAMQILYAAPDPLEILSIYIKRFHPNGWSGSLANILQSRLPLLESLEENEQEGIAKAAQLAKQELVAQIEKTRAWEAENDRERDEQFEW